MIDLLILIPSRGRPQQAAQLAQKIAADGVEWRVIVDADDEKVVEYSELFMAVSGGELKTQEPRRLGPTLNYWGNYYSQRRAVAFFGDDHWPSTIGWPAMVERTLGDLGSGICYGNDLVHGENLPTAWFMTCDIIRELGYMVPRELVHLFLDDAIKALGQLAGCIRYIGDRMVVEHRHPVVGKATWDETYQRANENTLYISDGDAYKEWVESDLPDAAAKIRALRA